MEKYGTFIRTGILYVTCKTRKYAKKTRHTTINTGQIWKIWHRKP